MTETTFNELIARTYQRLSAHQIELVSINTKYHNEKKRRGSYFFQVPLVYYDDGEQAHRIITELMYNPAFKRHFITHTLNTEEEGLTTYIDELLTNKKADRNQTLLRILDESALREELLLEIKAGIANAVRQLKYWDYQRGKAKYRDPQLGSFALRPLREE